MIKSEFTPKDHIDVSTHIDHRLVGKPVCNLSIMDVMEFNGRELTFDAEFTYCMDIHGDDTRFDAAVKRQANKCNTSIVSETA